MKKGLFLALFSLILVSAPLTKETHAKCTIICCCRCLCGFLFSIDKTFKKILIQLTGIDVTTAKNFIVEYERLSLTEPQASRDLIPKRALVDPEVRFNSALNAAYILFGNPELNINKSSYTEIADEITRELKNNRRDLLNIILDNPPVPPTALSLSKVANEVDYQTLLTRYVGLITGEPFSPKGLLLSADYSQKGEALQSLMQTYALRELVTDTVLSASGAILASLKFSPSGGLNTPPQRTSSETPILADEIKKLKQDFLIMAYLNTKILELIGTKNLLLANYLARISLEKENFLATEPKKIKNNYR